MPDKLPPTLLGLPVVESDQELLDISKLKFGDLAGYQVKLTPINWIKAALRRWWHFKLPPWR